MSLGINHHNVPAHEIRHEHPQPVGGDCDPEGSGIGTVVPDVERGCYLIATCVDHGNRVRHGTGNECHGRLRAAPAGSNAQGKQKRHN